MDRPEDRAFARWRDCGDAEALARVYDAAAPALLRVAWHHVRDAATAEDLVQATFLAAIENAATYDAARPLLGWLIGILVNQARWLQRREGRSVDAARLGERASADPLAVAAAAEFTARCDEAIAALPEVYRPVLRLHLAHELPAAAIAHALDRPPGTVRSQITRGLELLRAALPAGVGLAAFAALTPARGLDAVREVVLAAGASHWTTVAGASVASSANAAAGAAVAGGAGAAGPVAAALATATHSAASAAMTTTTTTMTATAVAAGATMKKVLLGIVVGALLVVGTWSALDAVRAADQTAPPAAMGANAALAAAPVAAANDPGADAPAPPVRTTPLAAAPTWRLVGAVVDAEGRAIVDASVRVSSRCEGSEADDVATVRTGPDGRYVADLAPLRAQPPIDLERTSLAILVRAPGGLASASAKLPHVDVARDLVATADATLQRGAIATGRVVDASGRGVHGAEVALRDVAGGASPADTQRDTTGTNGTTDTTGAGEATGAAAPRADVVANCASDADGSYVLFAATAADVQLTARHHGFGRGTARVRLAVGSDTVLPDLVLQPLASVRGRVVFADGEPAPGVDLTLRPANGGAQPHPRVTTGLDGGFAFRNVEPGSRWRVEVDCLTAARLPQPLVVADGEPGTIVLTGVHGLRLRFEDEAGRSLQPLDIDLDAWSSDLDDAIAAVAAGGDFPPELGNVAASMAGRADALLVGAGSWVLVRARHGLAHGETLVQVAPPRNMHDVLVALRERTPTATLRVRAARSDGQDLTDLQLRLRQLRLGQPGSYALATERDGHDLLARWAPGRYRFELYPAQERGDFGWYRPVERVVDLRAGETTTVVETLPVQGRVRLHLRSPDAADRDPIAELTVATPGASGAIGHRQFVQFHANGWTALPHAPANEPLMWMPLLPPGRHVLTIRSRDFVDVDVGVDIAPRVATDAHVWLQPK